MNKKILTPFIAAFLVCCLQPENVFAFDISPNEENFDGVGYGEFYNCGKTKEEQPQWVRSSITGVASVITNPNLDEKEECLQALSSTLCKTYFSKYSFGNLEVCPGFFYSKSHVKGADDFLKFGWMMTGKSATTTDFYWRMGGEENLLPVEKINMPNVYFTCDLEIFNPNGPWTKSPKTLAINLCRGTLGSEFE
jgi:hypothetical protein